MAELDLSSVIIKKCIDACVKGGKKLQLVLSHNEVDLGGSRNPRYVKLYRHIKNLQAQHASKTSKYLLCLLFLFYNFASVRL